MHAGKGDALASISATIARGRCSADPDQLQDGAISGGGMTMRPSALGSKRAQDPDRFILV
jgi:hypothetical protein